MGKNVRSKDSSNIPLQNGNSGCMNKILHSLNRRHRWQNVRKVLPNRRHGSGKHIIDGGISKPTENTRQPPEVHHDPKNNKLENEEERIETTALSSKNSKKFRIRSLISDEMAKRRGKHHRRRSFSPSHSPKKKTNSMTIVDESDPQWVVTAKSPKNVIQSNYESPSTTKKKRKCDICAAMLTVSYLRQKGLMNEHQIQQNIDKNKKHSTLKILQVSDGDDTHYLHSHASLPTRIGLKKSFSFPLLRLTKRRDFELEELMNRLKECKDIQTTKEKFILPMNQWKDIGLQKPMLTRPESFKTPSSSQKEKKQASQNSKSLKQKIGFVIRDGRKEKRRILMDAVFHKIPYGRRSSKDVKKAGPDKLKCSSTSSSGSDQSFGEKVHLKKTLSTSETMSKYRRLLSQTSTRDEKKQISDHKPRLFVAGDNSLGTSERKTLKRIRSFPNSSSFDFMESQDFPLKPSMNTDPIIAIDMLDNKRSSDHFVVLRRKNVLESITYESEVVDENIGVDRNMSIPQEKVNHINEFNDISKGEVEESYSVGEDEAIHGCLKAGQNNHDCQEKNDKKKEAIDENHGYREVVDENHGVRQNSPNHQDHIDDQKESRVAIEHEIDKSFNEILGMFKKVSDERIKRKQGNESNALVRKVSKNKTMDKDNNVHRNLEHNQKTLDHGEKDKSPLTYGSKVNKVLGVKNTEEVGQETPDRNEKDKSPLSSHEADKGKDLHKNLQVCQSTLNHEEKEKSMLTYDSEVELSMEDSMQDSSSMTKAPDSTMKGFLNTDGQYHSSINDQPSIDAHRPNNKQDMNMSSINNSWMIVKGFLSFDLELVKENVEFQFVKEVLEKAGFVQSELFGDWYSSYQPIDPLLFEEVETSFLQNKILEELAYIKDEEAYQKIINDHHLLLFDLINVALLEIQNKTFTYCPHPLTYCSKVRPMPLGCRVLEEVWDIVNMYLSWKPELEPSLDDVVSCDLAKGDGWMNLQADAEFVGIELEELLADDLLDELVFDDLLM